MRERENDKFIVTEWDKKRQNKKKRTGQIKSNVKVESSGKMKRQLIWPLMWLNRSVVIINVMLQFIYIYIYIQGWVQVTSNVTLSNITPINIF